MLEPAVRTRIREYIDAEVGPRDQILGIAIRDCISEFARRGTIGSSMCVLAIARVCCDELTVRAEIAWQAISRSHESMVGRPDRQTLEDLKLEIGDRVSNQARSIAAQGCGRVNWQGTKWHGTIKDQVNERCRQMLAKLSVKAAFYVEALERATQATASDGGQGPVFNAPIGVVQFGEYATANVSLSTQESQQFSDALEAFKAALVSNGEIPNERRDQADELVENLLVAVRAEKPNPPLIAGLFGALGQTVSTVASIRPAWETVRDAAIAIGMMLR